jgi:MFS family permease
MTCFYGYVVVLTLSIGFFMSGPGHTTGLNMFLNPLMEDLKISRVTISLCWMGAMFASSLFSPCLGVLLDNTGARKIAPIQAVLYALVFLGLAYVQSVAQFSALLCMLRFLGPEALNLIANTTINRWFVKKRALACSIYALLGTCTMIQPVIFHWLINAFGWRKVYLIMSAAVLVVLLSCSLFLFDSPEVCGILPDGAEKKTPDPCTGVAEEAPSEDRKDATPTNAQCQDLDDASDTDEELAFSFAEAARTKEFWVVTLSYCTFGVFWSGTNLYVTTKTLPTYTSSFMCGQLNRRHVQDFFEVAGLKKNLVSWW